MRAAGFSEDEIDDMLSFGNALDQRAARSFVAACMQILIPALIFVGTLLAIAASGGLPPGG